MSQNEKNFLSDADESELRPAYVTELMQKMRSDGSVELPIDLDNPVEADFNVQD